VAPTRKPATLRPQARRDIEDTVDHYLEEAGPQVAGRFIAAVDEAFDLLSRNPGIGSLRFATELHLPGVRCWPLRPWPQLVFYVERERSVEVIRVLHAARDIPAHFAGPEGSPPR
jgi:toxin ParE1/3/4